MPRVKIFVSFALFCAIFLSLSAEAKKSRKRRYTGPPPTHPVVLWAKTLAESTDREQRKIAAFKLSQFSQTIYQQQTIDTLIKCMQDTDVHIKVLCTKAMSRAGSSSQTESVRAVLLERYQNDPTLRSTIVHTFTARKDNSPKVHELLLTSTQNTTDPDELLSLLTYFEKYGSGSDRFVDILTNLYKKQDNVKIKRATVKALAEKAQGQDGVIALFSQCMDSKDTPLVLTCLSGLQAQAKKDQRAWEAAGKALESEDPDVLLATLDLINALPEKPQPLIAKRLITYLDNDDDVEVQEKAVLGIGVAGDQSEPIVQSLQNLFDGKSTEESVRIAAALVMGKQAARFPDKSKSLLQDCSHQAKSQALRTACQLGLKDLETSVAVAASKPAAADRQPTESAAPVEPKNR